MSNSAPRSRLLENSLLELTTETTSYLPQAPTSDLLSPFMRFLGLRLLQLGYQLLDVEAEVGKRGAAPQVDPKLRQDDVVWRVPNILWNFFIFLHPECQNELYGAAEGAGRWELGWKPGCPSPAQLWLLR